MATQSGEPGRKHWNTIAQCWHLYSSPLRPGVEDIETFLRVIRRHVPEPVDAPRQALVLGVTPEIVTMPWPGQTMVTGADRSPEMIEHVWPGDRPGLRQALCVDWFNLPEPARAYEVVMADGSFNTLGYPAELRRLLAMLAGLTAQRALLITRTFTRPNERESLASLEEAARAGEAGGFHAFKFRLAMALQPAPEAGVSLDEIWRLWHRLDGEIENLSERNGWHPDVVGTIAHFRGKPVRLSFPTRDELLATLGAAGLSLLDSHTPTYEMGERCPILSWRF